MGVGGSRLWSVGRVLAWAGVVAVPIGLACAVGFQLWPWRSGTGWEDWPADLAVVGAYAVLVFALDRGSFRGRDGREAGEAAVVAAAALVFLAGALGASQDAVHEWRAAHVPTVPVTASLDGCRELSDGTTADTTVYRCQYHWSFQGHPRQEERDAKKLYTDGHTLRVVMDPATGSLVDTGLSKFVQSTVVAGFITCGSLCVLSLALAAAPQWLHRIRSAPQAAVRSARG
ncbi:hypothetical protein [Streptomyces collinus]|uniref:hypothetical protein n=1 Tax=Streptomyces collinus TaxID=42684 RepID=UPI003699DE0B